MSSPDNKVRVFISSTFRDMHAERDHLVTAVFPELRERCERLGLEFFDVDLRWGVPDKNVDGESANSWEYCRKWINEAKPFFVCLLGQRYGWEPDGSAIKDDDALKAAQSNPDTQRSITDLEVHRALEHEGHSRRCFFYLRQAQAPDSATEFVDPEPDKRKKLERLKAHIRHCGRPVWDYPCEWINDHFTGMEAFGKRVLADLWSGILRDPRYVSEKVWEQVLGTEFAQDSRYTDESKPVSENIAEKLIPLARPPPKDPLEAEREEMRRFADSRLRWFQGRENELKQLTDFIINPAEDGKPRLAFIAAVPGQGKSALMAKLAAVISSPQKSAEDTKNPASSASDPFASYAAFCGQPLFLISHFVGATSHSSSSYHLVKRLLDELDASCIAFPERPVPEGQTKEEPKLDFQSLCQRLWDRLGDYDGERRIVIQLDALNQLDEGHELGWLPYRLGPSVRIVVSCIEDASSNEDGRDALRRVPNSEASPAEKVLAALDSRHPQPLRVALKGITPKDVRSIVTRYLQEYCKELDAPHVDALCALPQARNPLYLLVLLAELRPLGGNDMNKHVPALIADLGTKHPDTISLFHWVLERMEQAEGFGEQAVRWWCLYLALGRAGMSSQELSDLLARKIGPEAAATAQRIERALRRYLQRRGDQWDFFHGQLRKAVMERSGAENNIRQGHRDIANYFRTLADPVGDQSWTGENQRPFNETASHFIGAEEWDELCAYLTDFRCLDRRIRAGQVFNVVTDQRTAIAALPEFAKEATREKERIAECRRYGDALVVYARECGAGKSAPLPVPLTSCRLTEHRLEWRRIASMLELVGSRIAALLSLPRKWSRSTRLEAFATFTANHSGILSEWVEDFLPLAANYASDGPLGAAAALVEQKRGWFERNNPPTIPSIFRQCVLVVKAGSNCAAASTDGKRVVSGGGNGCLHFWDLESGRCLNTLRGHAATFPGQSAEVYSVSISPDSRWAASASEDRTLRVWDLASGECVRLFRGHPYFRFTSVCLSPDGRRVVGSSDDQTIRVWDLNDDAPLHILQGHTSYVSTVSITPDGRRAVSGSWDQTLRVWDLVSGQCIHILSGHTYHVNSVSVTPDGLRAVSGSADKTLRVWDIETGNCLRVLRGHLDKVSCVSVTPDGQRAISGSMDYTLRVWDLRRGRCLRLLQGHRGGINDVYVTPDGCRVISCGDGTLRVWNPSINQCPEEVVGAARGVACMSISPDGQTLVSGHYNETLRIWNLHSNKCLHTFRGLSERATWVSVAPDGKRAVSGGRDGAIYVWGLANRRCEHFLKMHTGHISGIKIMLDGRRAISASFADKVLHVWDIESGRCVHTLRGHIWWVLSVCVTPNGSEAVSASADNTLRVWDIESGKCRVLLKGHSDHVNCVQVTPDSSRVVSGGSDKMLRIWDLQSGACLRILAGHTWGIRKICITADSKRLVSASMSPADALRIWDLDSGRCLYLLQGRSLGAEGLAVTLDGQYVVASSGNNSLLVWSARTGECIARYPVSGLTAFTLSPCGSHIVCGTADGQMHFLTMRSFSESGKSNRVNAAG